MTTSTQFSDTIHILAFMALNADQKLSSDILAQSVNTSPVVIRRLMGKLKKANLIVTTRGSGFSSLAAEPGNISLWDVYQALYADMPIFSVDENTSEQCFVGRNIKNVLQDEYQDLNKSFEMDLKSRTIQSIIDKLMTYQ